MDIVRTVATDGTISWQVTHNTTAADVLNLYAKIQANLAQLQTDAGSVTPPVVPPPSQGYPTFSGPSSACKGITAYSTNSKQAIRFIKFGDNVNSSDGSTNQYVYGANILLYWSQLEPTEGVYNWSVLDTAMQPWISNGKKVICALCLLAGLAGIHHTQHRARRHLC